MNGAGYLSVQLVQHDSKPPSLTLALQRSQVADRLCAGKTVAQALPLIGQTYTLCRYAQQAAAELALTGTPPSPALQQAIQLELIEQTLWRWLLDLPTLLLNENHLADYAVLRKQISRWQKSLTASKQNPHDVPTVKDYQALSKSIVQLLGLHALNKATLSVDDILHWLRGESEWNASEGSGLAARIIRAARSADAFDPAATGPMLTSTELQTFAADYCSGQRPLEGFTNACVEMSAQPLLTKLAAHLNTLQRHLYCRLRLLLDVLSELQTGTFSLSFGQTRHSPHALSWLMTARGLLIHRVTLERSSMNRIERYDVIAPTDLNFARYDQSCTFFLQNTDLMQGKLAARILELSVLTLDPCVDYDVEVTHA